MTPPKDPQNVRTKKSNSSRPAMDIADKMLKTELVSNGDGRFKYKYYEGEPQTDLSIAKRAGCNVSFISRQRRRDYGNLVPHHSEESKAARRKPFVYPNASSTPEPKPTSEINTASSEINIGSMGDLKRVLDRIGHIEVQNRLIEGQNREILSYLMVLYAAWKPVDAPMLLELPRVAA